LILRIRAYLDVALIVYFFATVRFLYRGARCLFIRHGPFVREGDQQQRIERMENMATAFIGLDYIMEIVHPQGKISHTAQRAAERGVIAKANRALAIAREKGWFTILVKVGFEKGYVDHPKHSPFFGSLRGMGALEMGSPGMDFHPELKAELADMVVVKPRISAFYGTRLDAALRARKVDRLIIAGVSTAWAVQSTVRDAHDRDYEVFVLEDACAAVNDQVHHSSMELLGAIAKVIRVEDLERLS
jgi:biuret amidohydrolase